MVNILDVCSLPAYALAIIVYVVVFVLGIRSSIWMLCVKIHWFNATLALSSQKSLQFNSSIETVLSIREYINFTSEDKIEKENTDALNWIEPE